MESYCSPSQLAQRLSLDRKTVYRAIERGELRAHRFGRALRLAPNDVQDWLERSVA